MDNEFDIEEAKALALAHFLDRVALYCKACGARSHHDCVCPRYEVQLPEVEACAP